MTAKIQPAQLLHFLALLERRSFRLAAAQLSISQSALTKSLQRLESQLAIRLFDRTTRSVVPTPMALELRSLAQAALQGIDRFADEARLLAGGELGQVRLAAVAVAEPLVVQALAALSASHPALELELAVGDADVYADLESGRCDIAVGDEANASISGFAATLRATRLRVEPLVMLYRRAHPLASAERTTLTQALQFPWAIPSRYFAENQALRDLATQASGPGFPRYRLSSVAACVQLVAASDVIALVPATAAQRAEPLGLSHAALPRPLDIALAAFTLARATLSPSVTIVLQALVDAAGSSRTA